MRFRFRLQRILDLKDMEEELKRKEFSSLKRLLDEEGKRLALIKGIYAEGVLEYGKGVHIDPYHLETLRLYLARIREELERAERRWESLDESARAKLEELKEAMKEVKVLEYLKEKGMRRHRKLEIVKEQAMIDEYNTRRGKNGFPGEDEG